MAASLEVFLLIDNQLQAHGRERDKKCIKERIYCGRVFSFWSQLKVCQSKRDVLDVWSVYQLTEYTKMKIGSVNSKEKTGNCYQECLCLSGLSVVSSHLKCTGAWLLLLGCGVLVICGHIEWICKDEAKTKNKQKYK